MGIPNLFEKWGVNLDEPLGLIFDVDELLCRNRQEIQMAYRMLLEMRGIFPAENEDFPGKDLFEIINYIRSKYGIAAAVEDLVNERREYYLKIIKEGNIACCGGVRELFQFLDQIKKERDIRIAYTSSSEQAFIDVLLEKIFRSCELYLYADNPNSFFYDNDGRCASTCWEEGMNKKPSSDVYKATLKKMDLDNRQCIAFEDSLSGFQAARSAGLRVVVVPSGDKEDPFTSFDYDIIYGDYIKLHSLMDFYRLLAHFYEHKITKV